MPMLAVVLRKLERDVAALVAVSLAVCDGGHLHDFVVLVRRVDISLKRWKCSCSMS
jgi:hypothetical protein